jgi:hypothetical protein
MHSVSTFVDVSALVAENNRLRSDNESLRQQVNALLARLDNNKGLVNSHEE